MTKDQLIAAFGPSLEAVLEIDNCPSVNDIEVIISKTDDGVKISYSIWARTHRFTGDDLPALIQEVRNFDPKEAQRQKAITRLQELKVELDKLNEEVKL